MGYSFIAAPTQLLFVICYLPCGSGHCSCKQFASLLIWFIRTNAHGAWLYRLGQVCFISRMHCPFQDFFLYSLLLKHWEADCKMSMWMSLWTQLSQQNFPDYIKAGMNKEFCATDPTPYLKAGELERWLFWAFLWGFWGGKAGGEVVI